MSNVEGELAVIQERGFIILRDLLSPHLMAEMRRVLAPHLQREYLGRNDFEGHRTERVYALVDKDPIFANLVEHPRILALCDALLEPNYLLTASQAIHILPGETAQALHTDDGFYRIPRPRAAVSVSTIWALDDFTARNGGTQVIPRSHTWDDAVIGAPLQRIDFRTAPPGAAPSETAPPADLEAKLETVVMPAGSVIFFLGTLLHRGGSNGSDGSRLALSNQYCEPWARQQENYTLGIPLERARRMSARVQALLGYSVHPPFMGHFNGRHPHRLLER